MGRGMKYRTIVADPPWDYDANGSVKRLSVYPRMTTEELVALPVAEWADTNAHLYLWVTNPKLYEGPQEILEAWGFRYITLLTWHKLGAVGLGWYFRGDTEHIIFAVRGKAPIEPAIRQRNHFAAARGAHSAKPDRFYEIVERVSPEPRLELFARRRRVGWDVWGNEAPDESEARTQLHMDMAS